MRLKDERSRLTGEIFSGIRVVKLYAWESAMATAVDRQDFQRPIKIELEIKINK
jgi:hypothetical protein